MISPRLCHICRYRPVGTSPGRHHEFCRECGRFRVHAGGLVVSGTLGDDPPDGDDLLVGRIDIRLVEAGLGPDRPAMGRVACGDGRRD